MIYITGFNFIFYARPKSQSTGVSVQEKIMAARHNMNAPKTNSAFDLRFVIGHTYKIVHIKKIIENKETKICYLFADMTDNRLSDIDILFSDTAAGDNYIAAISGNTQQLTEERGKISATLESNNDV